MEVKWKSNGSQMEVKWKSNGSRMIDFWGFEQNWIGRKMVEVKWK
jgi:hypothetical protein